MTTKDEYVAKLKAQLDEWETDLAHLRDKAGQAKGSAEAMCVHADPHHGVPTALY